MIDTIKGIGNTISHDGLFNISNYIKQLENIMRIKCPHCKYEIETFNPTSYTCPGCGAQVDAKENEMKRKQ